MPRWEKAGNGINDATFAPLGPVDAKIALVAGSIDGWAVWEPYISYATLKDNARVVADGEGLTPTITFYVASDQAIATKRAAVQDLVQRLNKARLWSLDHIGEYAKATAELTKLPGRRVVQCLHGAAHRPGRDRHQRGQRNPAGFRSRHPIRHSRQGNRRQPSGGPKFYS